MEKEHNAWNYKEFLAYLLLYAAESDFIINVDEKAYLFKRVDSKDYLSVVKEFKHSNDTKRLQTVMRYKEKYFNDEKGKLQVLQDMKEMFFADFEYNTIEQGVFLFVRKIL